MATVQLHNPTQGRAYYDRKKLDGKTSTAVSYLGPDLVRRVPDALSRRRAAAAAKRGLLAGGEDRRTIDRREGGALDTEGSQMSALPLSDR